LSILELKAQTAQLDLAAALRLEDDAAQALNGAEQRLEQVLDAWSERLEQGPLAVQDFQSWRHSIATAAQALDQARTDAQAADTYTAAKRDAFAEAQARRQALTRKLKALSKAASHAREARELARAEDRLVWRRFAS